MLTLLVLYKWTILAGLIAAPALSLLGIHLATRDRSMQTLCLGQGAMVGVLCGIGVLHSWENTVLGAVGPFTAAILMSALTFVVTDKLVAKKNASKNTTFAFVFSLLLAAGYLVSSVFPALESHMAQVYFGDLATLTEKDSIVALIGFLLCLTLIAVKSSAIANQSFELAIFGHQITAERGSFRLGQFKFLTLVMLCFSVQFLGFLFTIAMLFLPTAMANYLHTKGLKLHTRSCVSLATVSTLTGFVLSLYFTRLPTVPAIVAVMFVLALLVLGVEAVFKKVSKLRRLENGFSAVEVNV